MRIVASDQPYYSEALGDGPGLEASRGKLAHLSASDDHPYPMVWPIQTACGKELPARGSWGVVGRDEMGGDIALKYEWVICATCVLTLLS